MELDKRKILLRTSSEEETFRLGEILGSLLIPGITILLHGDLGTGKTVFVRGVGRALGAGHVRSPSFTLVNEYRTVKAISLVHVDLYRLESEGVDDLGLEDYLEDGCVLFVEWPERWKTPPGENVIDVNLAAEGETGRSFSFRAAGVDALRVLTMFAATATKEALL